MPFGHKWQLQPSQNSSLDDPGWSELLYRTSATYQCNHGHYWKSSWAMVTFRFRLDFRKKFGRARMKRFGVRCRECEDKDDSYHVGFCSKEQTWFNYDDDDVQNVVIADTNVTKKRGRGGAPHPKNFCEACANNCCQE
ncbi:unnamed protein product, partial [Adineta steineri]